MHITIFSPHLDDAALSCGEFVLRQRRLGHTVTIISLFTRYQSVGLSRGMKEFVKRSGFDSVAQFGRARRLEDACAMEKLGCEWQHWSFVDGGFRVHHGKPLYGRTLFSGQLQSQDAQLLRALGQKIKNLNSDRWLLPSGVGGHIDHVITRQAGESVLDEKKIFYYLDYPYAQKISLFRKLQLLWGKKKRSVLFPSSEKKQVLLCYRSQLPLLFPQGEYMYPEIVFQDR